MTECVTDFLMSSCHLVRGQIFLHYGSCKLYNVSSLQWLSQFLLFKLPHLKMLLPLALKVLEKRKEACISKCLNFFILAFDYKLDSLFSQPVCLGNYNVVYFTFRTYGFIQKSWKTQKIVRFAPVQNTLADETLKCSRSGSEPCTPLASCFLLSFVLISIFIHRVTGDNTVKVILLLTYSFGKSQYLQLNFCQLVLEMSGVLFILPFSSLKVFIYNQVVPNGRSSSLIYLQQLITFSDYQKVCF